MQLIEVAFLKEKLLRLAAIIQRKQDLNDVLRGKLQTFKDALTKEEELSSSLKGK